MIALQTAQISMAECEAAKAQANGAISEGQTSHSALIQATHRIQQLDQENNALKSELAMLRAQLETGENEARKYQNINSINADKLSENFTEMKRIKAYSQVCSVSFALMCSAAGPESSSYSLCT